MRKILKSSFVLLGLCALAVVSAPFGAQAQDKVVKLPEVSVTATRSEREMEKLPRNVTVITRQEIEAMHPQTVTELLRGVPGLVVRDFTGTGALASIDILTRERLWENAARVGPYLLEKLRGLESPLVGDVRGKGLMIGVELVGEDGAMLDAARRDRVEAGIRQAGVLVGRMSHAMPGPESVFYIAPPLILTTADADRIAEAFRAGLAGV